MKPVPDVHLLDMVTDQNGYYSYEIPTFGMVALVPIKSGGEGISLSSLDAAWMLSYSAGAMSFSPAQIRLGDLTMNNTISALDAARALRYAAGLGYPERWSTCGSWGFSPNFTEEEGVTIHEVPPCGWIVSYEDRGKNYINQDWKAWVWGDVTGNW